MAPMDGGEDHQRQDQQQEEPPCEAAAGAAATAAGGDDAERPAPAQRMTSMEEIDRSIHRSITKRQKQQPGRQQKDHSPVSAASSIGTGDYCGSAPSVPQSPTAGADPTMKHAQPPAAREQQEARHQLENEQRLAATAVGDPSDAAASSAGSLDGEDDELLLLADYPRFRPHELRLGQILGKGSFNVVREIVAFDIESEAQVSTSGGYRSTASLSSAVDLTRPPPPPGDGVQRPRTATSRTSYVESLDSMKSVGSTGLDDNNDDVNKSCPGKDSDCSSQPLSATPSATGATGGETTIRRSKRDSLRSCQSYISSARSIAFGIEGRTFLARHCIRTVGDGMRTSTCSRTGGRERDGSGNDKVRGRKKRPPKLTGGTTGTVPANSGHSFGNASAHSFATQGSHESEIDDVNDTRNRILARLGLSPSNSKRGFVPRWGGGRRSRSAGGGSTCSRLRRRGEGDCRYAVKSLRDEVLSAPDLLEMALADLRTETRILANVEHPNIVKMRAFASDEAISTADGADNDDDDADDDGPRGYFIVMDRLYDTLEQRIGVWSKKLQKAQKLTGWLGRSKLERDVWEQRLVAVYDLANALNYLHSMGIAYRDIKPQNIAFDVRGDCKLFDFGLAKELNPTDMSENGTYEPSSVVGALRYMAPEVCRCEPYNLTVDTFSFSILLWEILTLEKPYGNMNLGPTGHKRLVIDGGLRPPLHDCWSDPLRALLQTSWSDDLNVRPPMSSIIGTLKWELASVRDDMAEGILNHDRRRSTFVLMKTMKKKQAAASAQTAEGGRGGRKSIIQRMSGEIMGRKEVVEAPASISLTTANTVPLAS